MRFYAIVGRGKMRICARLVFDEDIGRRVKTDSRILLSAGNAVQVCFSVISSGKEGKVFKALLNVELTARRYFCKQTCRMSETQQNTHGRTNQINIYVPPLFGSVP